MNETSMTVVGNVVDEPRVRRTGSGHYVANFRLASTTRRFDREKGAWADASTLFVNVSAWRGLAENIALSVHKGQPLVVTGRYYQREYTVDEQPRTSYELEAVALGHDLNRGVATFRKVPRSMAAGRVEVDADGIPEDPSSYDSDDDRDDARDGGGAVDVHTGEIRELAPAG